ncbi:MAG TPA: sigma 54-interacting transcriptional regulator, partial [Burkholderiaceae bacterium]|nr:sigma 54-interacting transcriptional regulator [Burkholderiaceae bacterium]
MAPPTFGIASNDRKVRRGEGHVRPIAGALKLDAAHVDVIDRSHERCAALGLSRIERPDFGLLGQADLEIARARNRRLHQHAAPVMELLYDQIVNTHSMVVLADATGTIVHAIGDDDFLARAAKIAVQPGAIWSEAHKGTNAAGTALVTELPTLVHADEHFLHANHFLTCSAAPILDPRGNILGVLDVSGDHRSYHQHTMALVKMSARMIENHWLTDDLRNVMRLHFHGRVDFIGTLMEGIVAVRPDGRIVGANRSALEQLGMSGATLRMQSLETLFDTSVGALVDRFRSPLATPLAVRTASGRRFHLHARFDWPVWSSLAEAVAAQVPGAATLSPALRAAAPTPVDVALPADPQAPPPGDTQAAAVVARLERALERRIPSVLIGDAGSGKQWLARAAHQAARPRHAFAVLSCVGLEPGAIDAAVFDGALGDDGAGTLYLDAIGHLAPASQQRLLQLLDADPSDVGARDSAPQLRLVCASRRPLRALVDYERLREDLFYRLNGLSLRVPALRERSDLVELARSIVEREAPGRDLRLTDDVIALLRANRWPGNLRQLHNVLRTAVALAGHSHEITRGHLGDDVVGDALATGDAP